MGVSPGEHRSEEEEWRQKAWVGKPQEQGIGEKDCDRAGSDLHRGDRETKTKRERERVVN